MHAHERLEPHAEVDDLRTSPRPKKFQNGISVFSPFTFCYSFFSVIVLPLLIFSTLCGAYSPSLRSLFLDSSPCMSRRIRWWTGSRKTIHRPYALGQRCMKKTLCVCLVSSVGDLSAQCRVPWRGESLGVFAPPARHRFLVSSEFCGRSFVCGSWIALLCVCSVSDGRSLLRLVESVFLVSSHRLLVLWVSFRSFVVHIGFLSWFLGLGSCGEF